MENNEQPASQPSHLLLTPLMISLIGILSTALAILLYNFILTRYCANRSMTQSENRIGVDEKAIDSIPVIPYTVEEGGLFRVEQTECSVCLGEFEQGQVLRLLPHCRHAFHVGCIDQWLFSHTNCPLCRSSIVLTYVSSELSLSVEPETDCDQSTANNEQGEDAEAERNRVLRHSASVSGVLVREEILKSLQEEHKRSVSLDFTYTAVKIQRDAQKESSSPSSSSSTLVRTVSTRLGSSKRLDLVSSMVMKSLRLNQCNIAQTGILPR